MELFYYLKKDSALSFNCLNATNKASNGVVLSAINYIKKNYKEKITLEILARKFSYSKNYFQTIFKSIIGYTPQEYITNLRIEKAKLILNDPNILLIDISKECGFSSQAYFNYIFKQKTGLTPFEYRKGCIQNYFTEE